MLIKRPYYFEYLMRKSYESVNIGALRGGKKTAEIEFYENTPDARDEGAKLSVSGSESRKTLAQ